MWVLAPFEAERGISGRPKKVSIPSDGGAFRPLVVLGGYSWRWEESKARSILWSGPSGVCYFVLVKLCNMMRLGISSLPGLLL